MCFIKEKGAKAKREKILKTSFKFVNDDKVIFYQNIFQKKG